VESPGRLTEVRHVHDVTRPDRTRLVTLATLDTREGSRTRVPPNSKHWFTTSFLGGRCRKAILGVCVPPSPTRVTLQIAPVCCRHQGHTKPFSDVITLRVNRCPAVTSPWYSGIVVLVAWENAALGTDRFATRSSGSSAGCARIRGRMRGPEKTADARQEENERKAAAEQALPCRQAVSSHV